MLQLLISSCGYYSLNTACPPSAASQLSDVRLASISLSLCFLTSAIPKLGLESPEQLKTESVDK